MNGLPDKMIDANLLVTDFQKVMNRQCAHPPPDK
jgi:hypothetical protein